jgi:hypothetical protein
VNEIATVHGKTDGKLVADWKKSTPEWLAENIKWVEKEKVLDLLGMAPPKGATLTDPALVSIAKIIQDFQNPTVSSEKSQSLDEKLQSVSVVDLEGSRENDTFAENNNENGTEISEQLPQETDSGGIETSTNMERTTPDNQSGESAAGYVRQATVGAGSKAGQLDVIEKTAKEKGVWIDSPSSLGDYFSEGGENEVYFNPPGNKVYKVNNFEYAGDDVLNFFDRIDAHNELFGNVPYKITGFTRNRKGEVSAILEQPYVEAEREATEDEIASYMESLGFEANGIDDFSNGKYNVFDAVPNNVLVGKDGRLYFIDTVINHSRGLESRENESVVREPAYSYSVALGQ